MLRFCYGFLDLRRMLARLATAHLNAQTSSISAFDNVPERDLCSALFITST